MAKMAADGEKQQGHRAGIYKQKNKGHKHGKHRTKGEVERENKGESCSFVKCCKLCPICCVKFVASSDTRVKFSCGGL